jgi:glucokinase
VSGREAIGADLGGTKLATGVIDEDLNILHESRESSTGRSEDEVVGTIEEELREAMAARPGIIGAGLGIPCTIDRERGLAINAVNLEITDVPIRDIMRERLGIPVFMDNDGNCAALAEHRFGAAKGAQNALLLTIGTGIGGGIIIDKQVYRGTTGAAAELGHVVVQENGPPCQGTCPNHGCVETMASGTALAREGTAAAGRHPGSVLNRSLQEGLGISGKVVTDAALAGDEVALEVVAEAGRQLGVALASLVNIFDPDVVVIGGGVAAGAGDLLVDPAREEMRQRALPPMNNTPVALAELGADAGMIGAAQMVREELAET